MDNNEIRKTFKITKDLNAMLKQAVKNYNIQVDIYNKLLDMGIIQ